MDSAPPKKCAHTGGLRRRLGQWCRWAAVITLPPTLAPLLLMVVFGLFASPERSDVIVVPGAALWEGGARLSNALEWRMETAVELYHQGYAPCILLSGGGQGRWSEAHAMQRWAVERGVPKSAILIDDGGDTTRCTAEHAARMMRARGMRKALVVSQWYHVTRLRFALEQAGVEVCGSACAHPRFLNKEPWFALREIPALYMYALRLDEQRAG